MTPIIALELSPDRRSVKGLRQFLAPEQQRGWMEDETTLPDADERSQSLEQRFKYAGRFERLLRRPQAREVLEILRIYGETCLPIPRRTERHYWSVSCLPSTSDKPLARVNASWMELFTLLPDNPSPLVGEDAAFRLSGGQPAALHGEGPAASAAERLLVSPPPNPPHKGEGLGTHGLRARFILHLSDFTTDGSSEPDHLDLALLDQCVEHPENLTHFFWKADTFGVKIRTAAAIRANLACPHALRAIRRFNLTHMNRGRNAYQASHCYSLADYVLGD